jgi:hypothetical protein
MFAQVFHEDPEPFAVRELIVATACTSEVCIDFEAMADVTGDDERWRRMIGVQEKT